MRALLIAIAIVLGLTTYDNLRGSRDLLLWVRRRAPRGRGPGQVGGGPATPG
jgi:hypothetical protein